VTKATAAATASPGGVPDLDEHEVKDVEDRVAPRPVVVYEAIRREGERELTLPWTALAWSGFAAGLSMGFSLVAQGLLRASLPDVPWRPLVVNLGYSVGFLIVIIGRQQLFTENTLTPILPLLNRPNAATLLRVTRLWGVVLVANLVGALVFASVIGHTEVFEPTTRQAFTALGQHAMVGGAGITFLRAIFAGWLIALMVWLLPGAETARLQIIVVITYLVGLGGLSHIIAGAVEVFYVLVTGVEPWSAGIGHFLLPTLAGNIIGGLALVSALNHAQVTAGDGEEAPAAGAREEPQRDQP